MGKKIHPKLEALKPIVKGIAATFGKNCEVVIHDLSNPDSSLIYLEGNVTKRQIGAPSTNLVLEAIRRNGDNSPDLIGYFSRTKDGHLLKSSSIFIRNDDGEIVGSLCINFNLTDLIVVKQFLDEFTKTEDLSKTEFKDTQEQFSQDINEVLNNVIEEVIRSTSKPVPLMSKEDKINVVESLDLRGVFLVKGSVDQVAKALGVSRYTVYNYLEEARALKNC